MEEFWKEKDEWGHDVIFVNKCNKYEYEDPEIPKNPIFSIHNPEIDKIYDIIDAVENYFYDSGKQIH